MLSIERERREGSRYLDGKEKDGREEALEIHCPDLDGEIR